MPSVLQKFRNVVMGTSIVLFSQNVGGDDQAPRNEDKSEAESALEGTRVNETRAQDGQPARVVEKVEAHTGETAEQVGLFAAEIVENSLPHVWEPLEGVNEENEELLLTKPLILDWSFTDIHLQDEGCSQLSYVFKRADCREGNRYATSPERPNDFDLMNPYAAEVKSRFRPFDCGSINFTQTHTESQEEPSEKMRCIGNFDIIGGQGWSVKGAASMKQDISDITNTERFGLCPEGNTDCVGFGVEFNLER